MADTKTPDMKNKDNRSSNEHARSEGNKSDNKMSQSGGNDRSDNRQEKSAIGGGQQSGQTGEPGRARNELDQERGQQGGQDKNQSQPTGEKREFDKNRSETGQKSEFDKNRSEPTSSR